MSIKTEDDYKKPKLMVPKDFIRYKVKQLEKNSPYYKGITTTSKTIDEVIDNIKQSKENVLTLDQFNTIKELAVNKGGFLSMENRRFLYKKILNVNEKKYNKYYDTIWINKQNNKLYTKEEYLYQCIQLYNSIYSIYK